MYLNEMPFGQATRRASRRRASSSSSTPSRRTRSPSRPCSSSSSPARRSTPPSRTPSGRGRLQREILDQMVQAGLRDEEGGGRLLRRVLGKVRLHAAELQRVPRPGGQGALLQRVHPRPARRAARRLVQLSSPTAWWCTRRSTSTTRGRRTSRMAQDIDKVNALLPRHSRATAGRLLQRVVPAPHRHARAFLRHRRPDVPQPQRHRQREAATTRSKIAPVVEIVSRPVRPPEGAGHRIRGHRLRAWP